MTQQRKPKAVDLGAPAQEPRTVWPALPLSADLGCARCRLTEFVPFSIDMAFQPIFDLRSGSVFAYEALVRGPAGEPAHHILTRVTREGMHAFDQLARLTALQKAVELGLLDGDARLSINFFPAAVLEARRCLQPFLRAAAAQGLPANRVIFEFTETEAFDIDHARAVTNAYAEQGIATALDDFGGGFAGLSALVDIATDFVKLDMGLIRGIEASAERQMMVTSITRMIRDLGSEVIAEGIATRAELDAVQEAGVELVQGYYLGEPSLVHLQTKPYAAEPL